MVNIAPSCHAFIGDSIHGISGEKQAGIKIIGVTTPQPTTALKQANLAIERLTGLRSPTVKKPFNSVIERV